MQQVPIEPRPPQDYMDTHFAAGFTRCNGAEARRTEIFDGTFFRLLLTGADVLMPSCSSRVLDTGLTVQLPMRVCLHLSADPESKVDVQPWVHGHPDVNATARIRLAMTNRTASSVTLKEGDLLGRGGFIRLPPAPECSGVFIVDNPVNNEFALPAIPAMEEGDAAARPTTPEHLQPMRALADCLL